VNLKDFSSNQTANAHAPSVFGNSLEATVALLTPVIVGNRAD
jgi:hypothetical protein